MISREEMFQMKTVYHYIPKNISVKKDIVYQTIEPERSKMDIYYASSNLAPTVILIHGEMRDMPDMKEAGEFTSLGEAIASAGMNAITFNHRVSIDGVPIAGVISDIQHLIGYVMDHANELHLDAEHIALWSLSCGVPYGLSVGLSGMYPMIKCLVAYYGFADFEVMKQCLLGREVETEHDIKSPAALIHEHKPNFPPILIARSGLDDEKLNATMDAFLVEALRNNIRVDFYSHPMGHHAFDIFDDNERTQEIIERTMEFLSDELNKKDGKRN